MKIIGVSRKMILAGVDEAGRGPLAGPVVAAAAVLDPFQKEVLLEMGLTDSKKLSPAKREKLMDKMISLGVVWRARAASPARIDSMNILRASLWAMERSVLLLPKVFDKVIVDGTFCLPGYPFLQEALPKADLKVPEVAAASIFAKVLRDRAMCSLDRLYPQYGFAKHKGYPTSTHLDALREYGPSPVHRRTFKWDR